jgi:4-amino-4-deoxy-L-arabinose transferase-like glycosyltransferase
VKRDLKEWGIVGLVALLALAIRLHGIGWGLPEGYEEAIPFKRAWDLWGWTPGRHLDLNPHFFRYPSLTIYLQFLGQGLLYAVLHLFAGVASILDFRVLYQLDKTPFFLMGRGITLLMGTATVVPAYLLARRVAGRAAAVAAAFLVAVNPALVGRSQAIEVDVPLTLFVTLGCLLAVRLAESPRRHDFLRAGLVAGLATTSKYTGLAVLLPMLVASIVAPTPAPRQAGHAAAAGARSRREKNRRSSPRPGPQGAGKPPPAMTPAGPAWRVRGLVLLALAFAVTVFVTSPFLVLDFASFRRDMGTEQEHMALGHFGTGRGPAWLFYAGAWVTSIVGWPLALAGLAGIVFFLGVRRQPWAMVLASFVLPYYLVVGSWSMKAERYLLPLVPPAIVFAVALVAHLVRERGWSLARAWREPATMVAASALFALPFLAWYPAQLAKLGPDTRTQARAWFTANVPAGAFILVEEYGPPLFGPLEISGLDHDVAGALMRRPNRPTTYAVQLLPMFQVSPERSARFYDLRLYPMVDYVVVTDAVRGRYRTDPRLFRPQLAFYEELEKRFVKQREFASKGAGTNITIYRNPTQVRNFAARRSSVEPVPQLTARGGPTGAEPFFYYNLGLNYDAFGLPGQAMESYYRGLQYPSVDHLTPVRTALRLARLLARQGNSAAGAAVLEAQAARSEAPDDAAQLRAAREQILAGGR